MPSPGPPDPRADARRNHELARRLEIERAVSRIARRFVQPDLSDAAIEASLGELAGLYGASRAYVFLFEELDGAVVMSNTHEHCAPGVSAEKDGLQALPATTFPWLYTRLARGEPVLAEDIELLPDEASAERETMMAQAIRSALILPVVVNGETGGFVGLDHTGRTHAWTLDDAELLGIVGELLGAAFSRARVSAALQEGTARLRAMVESLRGGALMISGDHRILLASRELGALFDLDATPDALVDRPCAPLLQAVSRAFRDPDAFLAPLTDRLPRHDEELLLADGRVIERDVHPVVAGEDEHATVWRLRDVTERRKLRARLLLADRMVSIGSLAAGVGHEINNPLAYVLANLDYAAGVLDERRGADPALDEVVEALADAREGAERVRRIVRDLKTLSRSDETTVGPTDLHGVLESSIAIAWNQIRHRALLVREYGTVPWVAGNDARLGQVFLNVLLNAAQAIPEGHARDDRVVVRTGTDARGWAVVTVSDTGHGMSEDVRAHIFDPFFTTKPIGTGTGLGLAICQSVVGALGGTIDVDSAPGRGTTFRIAFPPTDALPDTPDAATPLPAPLRRPRVLLVDDEPALLTSLSRALSDHVDVIALTSAADALARVGADPSVDAVITDLMMPDMTGMDLYEALRRESPSLAARTLFVTGGAFTPGARAFVDRFPERVFDKPLDVGRLRDRVLELARG